MVDSVFLLLKQISFNLLLEKQKSPLSSLYEIMMSISSTLSVVQRALPSETDNQAAGSVNTSLMELCIMIHACKVSLHISNVLQISD